ncbi:MAG: EFR1 family ferrodoxin [Clostridiales bacterium]|nr:EFR1 family ferrodoxin [Clostridiales bacterium]
MVLYFTGTGNSRFIAELTAEETGDCLYSINDGIKGHTYPDISAEERLIFSVPTYAWRLPRVINDWIMATDIFAGKKAYFFMNCGDSIGNAPKNLKSLCAKKDITYMGCSRILMPENYIAMFDCPSVEESERIVTAAVEHVKSLLPVIKRGDVLPEEPVSVVGRLSSGIINSLFYATCVSSKKFYSTDACVGCGKCSEVCPLNNIHLENSRPEWGDDCTHCMACICDCPRQAIEYGKRSQGKRRYHCPKISK